MKLFNRIITIFLIISLQACGVGTQSLLGNIGNKPNTSGPAVGPALSQTIEKAEQAQKQATDAPPARWILPYLHLMLVSPQQKTVMRRFGQNCAVQKPIYLQLS